MKVSKCCGSISWNDTDVCLECMQHTDFINYAEYNTQILLKEKVMDITGMIAIGNGEKCPYCDLIMEQDTDSVKHLLDHHAEEVMEELFNE